MSLLLAPASIFSFLGTPLKAAADVGLDAAGGWIIAGAVAMLREVVTLIGAVTTPSLTASWFSTSYWQVAGFATLLTVPFLFAAAVQAVIRTDLSMLLRAGLVDLPIALLAVAITAPMIQLLIAATDQMCALVMNGGTVGDGFLSRLAVTLPDLGTGFMPVIIAVVILIAGLVLLVELIMRAAAIYIVVLFLPLGFAAMVWPARRVWLKRMVELLIALILSKFAMVAILSLAVAGLTSISPNGASISTALTAMALMVLSAFSPWALLRLLPFTELTAQVSSLSGEASRLPRQAVSTGVQAMEFAAGVGAPLFAGSEGLRRLVGGGGERTADRGAPSSTDADERFDVGGDLTPVSPGSSGSDDTAITSGAANIAGSSASAGSTPHVGGVAAFAAPRPAKPPLTDTSPMFADDEANDFEPLVMDLELGQLGHSPDRPSPETSLDPSPSDEATLTPVGESPDPLGIEANLGTNLEAAPDKRKWPSRRPDPEDPGNTLEREGLGRDLW